MQAEVLEAALEKNGSVRRCVKRKGSVQGGKTVKERTQGKMLCKMLVKYLHGSRDVHEIISLKEQQR